MPLASGSWECNRCTYKHILPAPRCAMCNELRVTKAQMRDFIRGKICQPTKKRNHSKISASSSSTSTHPGHPTSSIPSANSAQEVPVNAHSSSLQQEKSVSTDLYITCSVAKQLLGESSSSRNQFSSESFGSAPRKRPLYTTGTRQYGDSAPILQFAKQRQAANSTEPSLCITSSSTSKSSLLAKPRQANTGTKNASSFLKTSTSINSAAATIPSMMNYVSRKPLQNVTASSSTTNCSSAVIAVPSKKQKQQSNQNHKKENK